MSILIEKVRIANFRCIKNVEVTLTPLTLLVGTNNAGKTSFLKALNIALGVERRYVNKEDFYVNHDHVPNDDTKILIDIKIIPVTEIGLRVSDFNDLWRDVEFGDLISIDSNDNQYVAFRTEICYNALKNDYEIKRLKINDWKEEFENWELEDYQDSLKGVFSSIPLFFIDAQRDIIADLRDRTSFLGKLISKVKIDPDKLIELESKISQLNDEIVGSSDVLSHLKEKLMELSHTINSANTGIDITPVNKKIRDLNKGLNINFQDGANESFPLDYHGMGTRSWASLLTFKAYITWVTEIFISEGNVPYHPILALEEPEAHLHPNAQRHLYEQLCSINGQKIISSHSPYIAGQCSIENIRHFYKDESTLKIGSFNSTNLGSEDLRKLRREVMNSRGELLFAKCVVLFEGETEEQSFPIFAKKYWGRFPFELGVNFVGVGGSGNYAPFLRFCISFNIPWFIFSDGEPEAIKAVKGALAKIGINDIPENVTIIPQGEDFEKYLITDGYQNEVIESIISMEESDFAQLEFNNDVHQQASSALFLSRIEKIRAWSVEQCLFFMNKNKTSLSPILANKITNLENTGTQYPGLVKSVFEDVTNVLNL